jgi:hypothetical protein
MGSVTPHSIYVWHRCGHKRSDRPNFRLKPFSTIVLLHFTLQHQSIWPEHDDWFTASLLHFQRYWFLGPEQEQNQYILLQSSFSATVLTYLPLPYISIKKMLRPTSFATFWWSAEFKHTEPVVFPFFSLITYGEQPWNDSGTLSTYGEQP